MKDQSSYAFFYFIFNGHLQFLQPYNHSLGYLQLLKKTDLRGKQDKMKTNQREKNSHLVAAR